MRLLVLATVMTLTLGLSACDDSGDGSNDGPGPGADETLHRSADQPGVEDGVLLARADGQVLELHDGRVECGPSEEDESVEVVRLTATERGVPPRRATFFYVEALPGTTGWFEMPLDPRPFDEGAPGLNVFGYDAADRNEVSSSGEQSTGSITLLRASCDPAALAFTIRATLDSEYGDLPPVSLVGGLSATG